MIYNIIYKYKNIFNIVNQFKKHIKDYQIILIYKEDNTNHKKKYKLILDIKKVLNKTVL